MVKVVSITFKNGGKPYYFAPGKEKYEKGMGVVVETSKGLEYATVLSPEEEIDENLIVSPLKPVIRIATKKDEEQIVKNRERIPEAIKLAGEKIAERGLEMKLVDCEFAFDGGKVTFYFTADSRVDFRELIKDLSSAFHMRIELRQIGIRDEIKMMGGLGPCGRECCCVACMPEPKKVSVKMAKNQGLSLNPGKISGLCNRLMCCLSYENDYYADVCKRVPKIGSEAETPDGKGTVVNVNMLKMEVKVKIEEKDAVSYHDYPVDKIRFRRGNEVFGADFDEEDDSDELPAEEEPETPRRENTPKRPEQGEIVGRDREKNGKRRRNHDKGNAEKVEGEGQKPPRDGKPHENRLRENRQRDGKPRENTRREERPKEGNGEAIRAKGGNPQPRPERENGGNFQGRKKRGGRHSHGKKEPSEQKNS